MRFALTGVIGILLFALGMSTAQTLEEKYQKKIETPFMKNVKWVQTYEEALKQAKAQNKLILGYFTRSYSP